MPPSDRQPSLFDAAHAPDTAAKMSGTMQPGSGCHLVDLRFDLRRFWQCLRHDGRPMPDWDLGYAVHSALFGLFGPEHAPKPFAVLPAAPGSHEIRVVGQWAGDAALVMERLGQRKSPWHQALLEPVKTYPLPTAADLAGGTFGFVLHARPTVRRHKIVHGREQDLELDAYQVECESREEGTRRSREEVYLAWLRTQLERDGACHVVQHPDAAGEAAAQTALVLRGWQLSPVYRKAGPVRGKEGARRGMANIMLPQADFAGRLMVDDADKFAALLARGVGRHRAFGFGLLLLRRGEAGC